jgi:uncharacterized XkdX family phage protein
MNWFSLVQRYYNAGYYTKEQVAVFVTSGKITPEQYQQITGDPYVAGGAA